MRLKSATSILRLLNKAYPNACCELNYNSPFELLVATILSAQCTDKQVNKVTPKLFAKYPDPESLANAELEDIEALIYSTGFYKNKSLSLVNLGRKLMIDHNCTVPKTLSELIKLPGVGRKTANVVLGNAFGVPALTIDTHFGRLARRWGWSRATNPDQVESDVAKIVPNPQWTHVSHRVIYHGRRICFAKKPACGACFLSGVCDSNQIGEQDFEKAANLIKSDDKDDLLALFADQ